VRVQGRQPPHARRDCPPDPTFERGVHGHGDVDSRLGQGLRIKEIPVRWRDERKSKFNVCLVAARFIANMLRVKLDLLRGRYD